ncbi:MAG: ABC transporter ATP-binding protein, partial [Gemmatimonadetes bacterium]|nr:ABC transporter ATP-binding protein [Gemmatimonadota bacterium]
SYGDRDVLDSLDLEMRAGQLTVLLGPSGCGKTTLLRAIAGLEPLTRGEVHVGNKIVTRDEAILVPPEQRPVGMVFQEHGLWPHLSAQDNVEYPLEVRGVAAAERRERARELLSLMDVNDLRGRLPGELSGGERQRVALARALIAQPKVLLLDEPLASLDTHLRRRLRQKIRRIHEGFGMTTLYVTHDREEALGLGDRIVVLRRGKVLDQGDSNELYISPRSAFSAQFLWDANLVPAQYLRNGWWETAIGTLKAEAPITEGPYLLLIHPESLQRSREPVFTGDVERATLRGGYYEAEINVHGEEVLWRTSDPVAKGERIGFSLAVEPHPVPDDRAPNIRPLNGNGAR